jgi:stigma-specific protein Stig1
VTIEGRKTMDGERFDRLAQAMGTVAGSRRAGLRIAMAAGAQLALGALGRAPAAAAPQPQGQRCKAPLKRCGKRCVDLSRDPKHCGSCHARCAAGQDCQLGSCQTCTVLQSSCKSSTECCNNGVLNTICEDSPVCDGLPVGLRCCRPHGGRCRRNCDCCGGLTCKANGRCG